MKIINILGYDYTVSYSPSRENGGMNEDGRCKVSKQRILVDNEQCEQAKASTILHEVLEAIDYHQQLELEHKSIVLLETALFQVLTMNGVDLSPLTKGL